MDKPSIKNVKPEEVLVFHYSRDRRLATANESVRGLYENGPRKKPNLFRTLTATRSSAFLLLAIIMLSLTALVTNFLVPSPEEAEYKGNRIRFSAFRFEGAVYVALKKTADAKEPYIGPASFHVRESGKDDFTFSSEIRFTNAKKEEFKFRIDAAEEGIEALLLIEGKAIPLKTKAQ